MGEALLHRVPRLLLTRVPAVAGDLAAEPLEWPEEEPAQRSSQLTAVVLGGVIVLGVSLVAFAYGLGRRDVSAAGPLFWLGQVSAFGAAIYAGACRSVTTVSRRVLVMMYVVGQALMTYAYSPVIFRFPDELQHLRTLTDILRSDHLFTPNPTLPVSPGFPGLEIVTTFVERLSGLSVTVSGRIVATVAHLLLGGMVFVLMRSLQLSERVATIGIVVFVASPSNIMFNSLFIYGALAIPFVWVSVVAAVRPTRSGVVTPTLLGVGGAFVCVVTHPASAMIALGGLWLVLVVALVLRDRVIVERLFITAGVATVFAACWVIFRSPEVVSYMSQPFVDVARSLTGGSDSSAAPSSTEVVRPMWESLVAIAAVLLQAGVSVLGVWMAWRERAPRRALLFVGSSLFFFVVVGLRFVSGTGSELSTRAWAYVGAFTAAAAGVVIVRLMARRRWVPFLVAGTVVLIVGNVISGWPGAWERVPGPSHVAAFENGITGETVGLGDWAHSNLPAGTRVACDLMACAIVASYSKADPAKQVAAVFYDNTFDQAVITERHDIGYDYVILDRRMGYQSAAAGSFFALPRRVGADTGKALSARAMAKFDTDPRVQKVFDDGQYAVYDVRGLPAA